MFSCVPFQSDTKMDIIGEECEFRLYSEPGAIFSVKADAELSQGLVRYFNMWSGTDQKQINAIASLMEGVQFEGLYSKISPMHFFYSAVCL